MENEKQPKKTEAFYMAIVCCRAVWKKISSQYSDSNGLFIGKILVAEYHWNAFRAKDDPLAYKVTSPIKGIKSVLGDFETEAECKDICLVAAKTFVKLLKHDDNLV